MRCPFCNGDPVHFPNCPENFPSFSGDGNDRSVVYNDGLAFHPTEGEMREAWLDTRRHLDEMSRPDYVDPVSPGHSPKRPDVRVSGQGFNSSYTQTIVHDINLRTRRG